MRGRLINPFTVEIAQLDTVATTAAGYDAEFRETKIVSSSNRVGVSNRAEALIKIPAQFYDMNSFLRLVAGNTGNQGASNFTVLFHFLDLERLGYVEVATGNATIKVGDRMNAVYDYNTGVLIQMIKNPPGAFVTSVNPLFGLGMKRNFLECTFASRDPGSG